MDSSLSTATMEMFTNVTCVCVVITDHMIFVFITCFVVLSLDMLLVIIKSNNILGRFLYS